MGLGLDLVARCARSTSLEAAVDAFAAECEPLAGPSREERCEPGRRLEVLLHPVAEAVSFSEGGGGTLRVTAKTSTVGPGYHAWLCERIDGWAGRVGARFEGEPAGEVRDDTGYFSRRDRAALEAEFLAWVGGLGRSLVERMGDSSAAGWKVNLATTAPQYEATGVLTPLGPRDGDYWRRVAADPRAGVDLFPWWEPGLGAGFLHGRALCRMWTDVRWRPPIRDDERTLLAAVVEDLARARSLDPRRPFPYREWAELLQHLDEPSREIAACATAVPEGALVGYRRRPLRTRPFPGVSIRIPGELAETYDEEGNWCAWDGPRTVRLTSYRYRRAGGPAPPKGERDPALRFEAEGAVGEGRHGSVEEEGATYSMLQGSVSASRGDEHRVLFVSIFCDSDEDRPWAVSTWKSIRVSA